MTGKRLTKALVFVVLLIALVYLATIALQPYYGQYVQVSDFYRTPKNTLDVIAIGSSHTYCTVNPNLIEDSLDAKVYTFATAALSFPGRYAYIKEACKYQSPKIIMMDVSGLNQPSTDFVKHRHEDFSYLKIGVNRYAGAFETVGPSLWEEVAFPLRLFHSNWGDATGQTIVRNFRQPSLGQKGFVILDDAHPITIQSDERTAKVKINPYAEKYIREIADYAQRKGVMLVLFMAPSSMENQTAYTELLRQKLSNKYPTVHYLDMNTYIDRAGLSAQTDFFDSNHLNKYGAAKIQPLISEDLRSLLNEN